MSVNTSKAEAVMELLTPIEAANMLRVSREQLKLMRRKQTGPGWIRISPKCIRYDMDTLRDWLRRKGEGDGTLQARKNVVAQISGAGPRS